MRSCESACVRSGGKKKLYAESLFSLLLHHQSVHVQFAKVINHTHGFIPVPGIMPHLNTFHSREVDEVASASQEGEHNEVDDDAFRPKQNTLHARPLAPFGGSPLFLEVTLGKECVLRDRTIRVFLSVCQIGVAL